MNSTQRWWLPPAGNAGDEDSGVRRIAPAASAMGEESLRLQHLILGIRGALEHVRDRADAASGAQETIDQALESLDQVEHEVTSLFEKAAANGDGAFELPPDGVPLEVVEKTLVEQALERSGGNRTRAGELLGLTRDQVRYRIEKFDLDGGGHS